MTIKKIKPVKPAGASAAAPAPATGSATIADRFKLDVPETSAKNGGTVGKKSAMIALGVGVLALWWRAFSRLCCISIGIIFAIR